MAEKFRTKIVLHQKTATFFHVPPKVVEKVAEPKRPETRARRVAQTIERVVA